MKKLITLCAALVAAMTMSAETITCEEAAAQALALGEGETATEEVSVLGYITKTNGTVSREQQTFYMDDVKGSGKETLQAYWANLPEDDKTTPLTVGSKVILTGKLMHYVSGNNHVAEIKNGNVEVLERVEVTIDTIEVDVCEAIEEGLSLNSGEYTDDYFEVSGVVSTITYQSDANHTQSFTMDCEGNSNNFMAYNCTIEGDYVAAGDNVKVLGKLTNYNGQVEIASGRAWVTEKGNTVIDTIEVSVAEALEAAKALGNNEVSQAVYVITGYVGSIVAEYSEQYNNISFYMCDDIEDSAYEFQAYRVKGGADLTVGTQIVVTGNLIHYHKDATDDKAAVDEYETNAGATYVIIGATEGRKVTFTASDFAGQGVSSTGGEVSATKDGVTFACNKAYGADYSVRCYKNSVITISAEENIQGIEFEFDPSNGNAYDGGLNSIIAVGATTWTSGELTSQARLKTITVTLGEGEIEEPEIEEITPEEALEIGYALEDNATTDVKYIVKGYVTYAKAYDTQYNNQSFYMASDPSADSKDNFYAFRAIIDEPGVEAGDFVTVEGKIKKYVGETYTTIEIENGICTIVTGNAIENTTITNETIKTIKDGQLIIIRNGVEYNAMGTIVK